MTHFSQTITTAADDLAARPTRPVEVRDLTAGYVTQGRVVGGRRILLRGVSFGVAPGEIVGVQGPNACGKSTMLKAIVNRRFRFGGQVRVDGRPLEPGEVAYVPQAPAGTLSPWLTARDEIALALRARGVGKAKRSTAVEQLLKHHSIHVPLDRRVAELSGGQRVKVAVLRALAVPGHRLVVMDEPFEGLDVRSRATLIQVIGQIASSGIPVIITSHRAEDLDVLGARRLVMEGDPVSELREVQATEREVRPVAELAAPLEDENGDALSRAELAKVRRGPSIRAVGLGGLVGFLAGLVLWAGLAAFIDNARLLPRPNRVGEEIVALLTDPENLPNVGGTIGKAMLWWIVANVLAVPLGIALGYETSVYRLFAPWLSLGRCLPIFALLGVAKGLFPGHSELQTGFLIWLTIFLISLHTLAVSAAMAPRRRMEIASILGANHRFRITRIMPFECLSGIFAALEITLPLAVIVTLVVGMFIFPKYDLAIDLYNNMDKPDLSKLFACVLIPGAFAAMGLVVVRRVSRRFHFEL